ncbi:DUF4145 domain-containing protein [Candidatus Microgenomates bacterium]|nr:DUF4145 domain-containing protein [Candidatus Microgenomates bacterium]
MITPNSAKLLNLIREIGNLSAHEIKKHHKDDLSLCLDIVEGVLRSLYIYPKEAEFTKDVIDGKWIRA